MSVQERRTRAFEKEQAMKTLMTAVFGVLMVTAGGLTAAAQNAQEDQAGYRHDDRRDDRSGYRHDDRPIYRHDDRPIYRHDPRFEFGFVPISFEIVRSREIVRPCGDLCGFRGDELPAEGVFRIETRFYTEFRGGRVLRTWTEEFEVFLHCYDRDPRREGPGWRD